jgi:DNA polymerase-3 subunit chi
VPARCAFALQQLTTTLMTQINFYTVSEEGIDARIRFACRLIDKAWNLGHRVFIQTESTAQAKHLDDMLWQYKTTSFVPHCRLHEPLADPPHKNTGAESVVISTELPDASHDDVLINLSAATQAQHLRFARINEIVAADPTSLEQGRVRYRFYKAQGHQPITHKL